MKFGLNAFTFLATVLALSLVATTQAQRTQSKANMSSTEALASIKPGDWVKLEGKLRKDRTLCTKMKILTGNLLGDDWQVTGAVKNLDRKSQRLSFLGLTIKAHQGTRFKNDLRNFGNLKHGMLVEVGGTYLKDGTFIAKEISDESPKLQQKPNLKDEIEVRGKVGEVDIGSGTLTLVGITYQFTPSTKIRYSTR